MHTGQASPTLSTSTQVGAAPDFYPALSCSLEEIAIKTAMARHMPALTGATLKRPMKKQRGSFIGNKPLMRQSIKKSENIYIYIYIDERSNGSLENRPEDEQQQKTTNEIMCLPVLPPRSA